MIKKSRFADEIGERCGEIEYRGMVKFCNDGVVAAVTFAGTDEFLVFNYVIVNFCPQRLRSVLTVGANYRSQFGTKLPVILINSSSCSGPWLRSEQTMFPMRHGVTICVHASSAASTSSWCARLWVGVNRSYRLDGITLHYITLHKIVFRVPKITKDR